MQQLHVEEEILEIKIILWLGSGTYKLEWTKLWHQLPDLQHLVSHLGDYLLVS